MAGQEWGTGSVGGNLAQAYLTKWLRTVAQPMFRFRNLCDVKEAIGKHRGDTFNWDKIANVATGGAYTGIAEGSVMPTDNFTVTKGTATITEYGNSIPYTRKLLELSQHELKNLVRTALANDMAKTIDKAVFSKLQSTMLVYQASAGTDTSSVVLYTNGTGTATNTVQLGYKHIINIVDSMKERNIPSFDGEDYVCIAHPTTLSDLRINMVSVNQYTETGYKKILNGEIGRFGGVRFVEQTNIAKVTPVGTGGGSWAVFTGSEAIIEALSVPEETVIKEVTDYGRSLGLGWYMIAGWKLAWGDAAADAANARCAFWWPNATSPSSLTP